MKNRVIVYFTLGVMCFVYAGYMVGYEFGRAAAYKRGFDVGRYSAMAYPFGTVIERPHKGSGK